MAATKQAPFTIAIDQQEKRPLAFAGFDTRTVHLKTGDYSLIGCEDRVCVERKSYSDAWQSMSTGRARFERCVKRMAAMDRAAIVVECTLEELAVQHPRIERTNIASVVGGLVSWACQYSIPVFFAGSRELASRIVVRWLASYWKHRSGLYVKG